jgi:soluble lytic murein transglycosylase-like protein
MKCACVLLSLSMGVLAQDPDPYEKARAAAQECMRKQRQALEKQRAAIRIQMQSAVLQADCDPLPETKIGPMIQETARREGIKEDLLRAVAERESGFRACAVSSKGAKGLMQLMPATAEQFGVKDPFDPQQSLDAGAKLLKQLLARYNDDVSLALGAYNAGAERVDHAQGVPGIRETMEYVSAILGALAVP